MRTLRRVVLVLAMLAVWGLAAVAWPSLPQRIPVHFDASGLPDAFAPRSAALWFALPALATGLGALLAFVLPALVRRFARTNSRWLNMPDKERFRALPTDARERIVAVALGGFDVLGVLLQALFGWIVHGAARVASGAWLGLPPTPTFALIGLLLLTALGMAIASQRAARREIERAATG